MDDFWTGFVACFFIILALPALVLDISHAVGWFQPWE